MNTTQKILNYLDSVEGKNGIHVEYVRAPVGSFKDGHYSIASGPVRTRFTTLRRLADEGVLKVRAFGGGEYRFERA